MAKSLRYRYSFIHNGQKIFRTSPATLATVQTFLAANDVDEPPAKILRHLDEHGTYVMFLDQTKSTIKAGTNIVEIDEVYI